MQKIPPEQLVHSIPPVYDSESQVLILGSFPSVKSREAGFFYGHPQNRFWSVLAALFREELPVTVPERRQFLLRNHIALWDVIASCTITGSSDSSIRDVTPNDLHPILARAKLRGIYVNGKTAHRLYRKYIETELGLPAVCLPSTSPANAVWSMERLIEAWQRILTDTPAADFLP